MNKSDVVTLIQFNFWANERILAACEQISVDQFMREVTPDPGWGSLRGILAHALDAEYGWRSLLQGQDKEGVLQAVNLYETETRLDKSLLFRFARELNEFNVYNEGDAASRGRVKEI